MCKFRQFRSVLFLDINFIASGMCLCLGLAACCIWSGSFSSDLFHS
jgi:hypothetical protein